MEHFIKPKLKDETASLLTTINTYVDLDEFSIKGYKSKTIVMSAVTNNLLFSIDFSYDASTWFNRLTDIAVNVGTPVVRDDDTNSELRGNWNYCRIQIKPAVADTHGTGTHNSGFSTL